MKDTPSEIEQLQRDIMHSRTDGERAMSGVDMIESTRKVVVNSIKLEKPHLTEREVVAELFERYYGSEFPEDQILLIKEEIKSFD